MFDPGIHERSGQWGHSNSPYLSIQPKGLRNEKKDGTEFRRMSRAKGIGLVEGGVPSGIVGLIS